jgi:hypothetical protein
LEDGVFTREDDASTGEDGASTGEDGVFTEEEIVLTHVDPVEHRERRGYSGWMAGELRRIRVVLRLKPRNYPYLLVRAQAVYNAMLENASLFPDPDPSLAELLTLVTSFSVAQQATRMRTMGAVETRNAKAALLITALEDEAQMVQGLCDASPEMAMVYITGAAMFAADPPIHGKELLAATLVPGSPGTAELEANAKMLLGGSRARATFHWQSSPNGGGTITDLKSTPLGNTRVVNLPLLADAWFRVSVTIGEVDSEWSPWVKVFVH